MRGTDDETHSLVTRLQARDATALDELYKRVQARAFALARRVVGDAALAEDAVQEAFTQLWERADRFSAEGGRIESLVMTMVHRRAIDLAPTGGQAYINLGYVYMRQGRLPEALETYEKALPLNPRLHSEIYNNLGLIYAGMGRMEDGEKALRKSIEIRPHNAAPYYNLGSFFEKLGSIDLAIEYYETAAKLAPDHHLTHEALGILYGKKGWKEKSREAHERNKKYAPR